MNGLRRLTAASLLALTLLSIGAPPALAHADLVSSDPKGGAELAIAPSRVTLSFSEPVDVGLCLVKVLDSEGRDIHAGPATPVAGQPRELSVALPPHLPDGVYTVNWRAVAADDGHITAEAFAFGVGTPPSAGATATGTAPPVASGPSVLAVTGKILLYLGLSVLFAAGFIGTLAFGRTLPAQRAVLILGSSAALAGVIAMVLAEMGDVGISLGTLLGSEVGVPYLWLLGLVGVTLAVSGVARAAQSRWALPLVGAGASAAMLTRAIGGHASAAGSQPWLQIGAQWFHFMSVGAWIGGLVLVVALLMSRSRGHGPPPVTEVTRFSTIAFWSVLFLAVSGGIRAVNELGGVSKLSRVLDSSYGVTLAVKVGGALLLVALGAVNRYRGISRLADGGHLFRRVIGAELVTALTLFGLTATLTSLPPATSASRSTQTPAPETISVSRVAGQPSIYTITLAGGVTISTYIDPGTAGPSQFHVTAFQGSAELPIASATLSATPADGSTRFLVSTRLSPGHFVANTTFPAGDWRFGIQLETKDGHTLQATFSQTIGAL